MKQVDILLNEKLINECHNTVVYVPKQTNGKGILKIENLFPVVKDHHIGCMCLLCIKQPVCNRILRISVLIFTFSDSFSLYYMYGCFASM